MSIFGLFIVASVIVMSVIGLLAYLRLKKYEAVETPSSFSGKDIARDMLSTLGYEGVSLREESGDISDFSKYSEEGTFALPSRVANGKTLAPQILACRACAEYVLDAKKGKLRSGKNLPVLSFLPLIFFFISVVLWFVILLTSIQWLSIVIYALLFIIVFIRLIEIPSILDLNKMTKDFIESKEDEYQLSEFKAEIQKVLFFAAVCQLFMATADRWIFVRF